MPSIIREALSWGQLGFPVGAIVWIFMAEGRLRRLEQMQRSTDSALGRTATVLDKLGFDETAKRL